MLWNILILLLIAAVVVLLRIIYENHSFTVSHYTVHHPKITKELDGYTIAFLSDLHAQTFGFDNEKLIERIQREKPDLILVGGDMLVAKKEAQEEIAEQLLKALKRRYPVCCANGNHESKLKNKPDVFGDTYERYAVFLKEQGIPLLLNESITLPGLPLTITGLELDKRFYQKIKQTKMEDSYMANTLGMAKEDHLVILLAHNPVYFPEYSKWGADLTLSGHVHGGMVRLPGVGGILSPQVEFFPKFDGGKYEDQGHTMILSRGLGTHTIKIRLFNRPELCMITLKRIQK